jgi:purine-binding chemotaxis protein CheW
MMEKPLAASNKLMHTYLSELLTEEQPEESAVNLPVVPERDEKKEQLDKLLQQASVGNQLTEEKLKSVTSVKSENKVPTKPIVKAKEVVELPIVEPIPAEPIPVEPIPVEKELTTKKSQAEFSITPEKDYRSGAFQAMFFDVAGLLIAVPLIELGGIHNVEKTTSLVGKPDWFEGVMLHRDEKINVVDTALWVMPEKCNETLKNSLNYQYIIMLNDSHWGLMAENLVDTVTLEQEDVKWLEKSDKRPWLAGLVKDRMCALLDVDELIQMLEHGANINQKTD